jgi:hypothetical protein
LDHQFKKFLPSGRREELPAEERNFRPQAMTNFFGIEVLGTGHPRYGYTAKISYKVN